MNAHSLKTFRFRVLILGVLAFAFLILCPPQLPAQTDACALVKAADLAALLGGTPTSKASPEGRVCTWVGALEGRKLVVLTYKNSGAIGETAFMGARKGTEADENGKVSDEAGLGDRAFSSQTAFGAVFVVLKQGRLLQLQYWTGNQGTSQDVAALRPVVQKAVAAF